jgi:alpha-1,2-mannosyltransferase
MVTSHGTAKASVPGAGVPPGRIPAPRLVYAVIAVCTLAAALLRLYQLTRPGYLLGVTEYDDGVQFGDTLRLVSGVIPYRDFVVVQPPGSILLMAPVALVAKATGSATGLAIARILTAGADTACVALLGLLVRHRGPVAAGVASGIYAVYPDALVGAHTFLLEPWLNLFCLIGALLVFDGDQITGSRRLAWGGVAYGVAVAVKLWALVPLAVVGVLVLRRPRRLALLAAGAVAGLAVPVLPFLAMAPGAFVNDVVISQFVRDDINRTPPVSSLARLTDLAGFSLFQQRSDWVSVVLLVVIGAAIPLAYVAGCMAARRPPAALDWYAVVGLVAIVVMFLWPYNYWSHYGAFAGPFIALVFALPAGRLRPQEYRNHLLPALAVGLVAAVLIVGIGVRQFAAETRLQTSTTLAASADRLIPAGSCVLTNDIALTVSADRFTSSQAGCPAMVDAWGTLLSMTHGQKMFASTQVLYSVAAMWQSAFSSTRYVWLESGSQGQIPWTPELYAYFSRHFRLIGLVNGPGSRYAPEGGLYVRR